MLNSAMCDSHPSRTKNNRRSHKWGKFIYIAIFNYRTTAVWNDFDCIKPIVSFPR